MVKRYNDCLVAMASISDSTFHFMFIIGSVERSNGRIISRCLRPFFSKSSITHLFGFLCGTAIHDPDGRHEITTSKSFTFSEVLFSVPSLSKTLKNLPYLPTKDTANNSPSPLQETFIFLDRSFVLGISKSDLDLAADFPSDP